LGLDPGALVAYLLIPVYGWRTAFWVGAIPALFAAYLRKAVPESPRYLDAAGKGVEADRLIGMMEKEAGLEAYQYRGDQESKNKETIKRLSLGSCGQKNISEALLCFGSSGSALISDTMDLFFGLLLCLLLRDLRW
jgi:MFS family permease